MMKEGKQFDDNLTVTKLTSIFASINSAAEEEEDGDDDEQATDVPNRPSMSTAK